MILALLTVIACKDAPQTDDSTAQTDDSDSAPDSAPPTDADGDGAPLPADCDDADATIFPGAAEVCDGRDQDCDGSIDDGVPNDGDGCQEPSAPSFSDTIGILDIIVRVGDGTFDGTDDGTYVCLAPEVCFTLNNAEWNDMERSAIDKFGFEGVNLPRAEVSEVTLGMPDGSDRFGPTCLALRFDGEPVYCREFTLSLGDAADEQLSWTDPEGLTSGCASCWPTVLTHGPMLGAVGTRDARVWWRTDGTRRSALRVARSAEALAEAAPVHVAWPDAIDDTTTTAQILGLEPDTTWFYDLEIDGARFGPWSFTTASEVPGPTRVAFGSCSRDDEQPIFEAIRAYDPDLFLFVGDNHYANSSELSDLRQYYRWAHERPGRAELLHEASILATWDDHDYTGNNTDGAAAGKDEALRAFTNYWANPDYGLSDVPGVFSTHRMGDVEVFLLDDRYYRGLEESILGSAQEAWLLDALQSSDATFKLVVSGSQFTLEGSDDSWGVYPEAQARLLQGIADRAVSGVVLLSGDIHRSELRLLPGISYDLPELTSSPMATSNSACRSSDELIACADDGNYFVGIDIDTALADPALVATIFDEAGAEVASWTIVRSALE